MKTLFQTIYEFKGGPSDFEDLLLELHLKFFDNLYAVYPQKQRAMRAVQYIVFTYSKDSHFIQRGESWQTVKERIAATLELDDEQFAELVRFEFKYVPAPKKSAGKATRARGVEEVDPMVDDVEDDGVEEVEASEYNVSRIITAISQYLDYQNDPATKHLLRMKELYEQVSLASVQMITKNKKGDIDWEQKSHCQKEAHRLYGEIENMEQKIAASNAGLREPIKELTEAKKRAPVTALRPEIR
jgi:hypothetical protein